MKMSKIMHVVSVVVGFIGVFTFLGAIFGGADNLVFGITKIDSLLCSGILILLAIWGQIGAIHHIILEKKGQII